MKTKFLSVCAFFYLFGAGAVFATDSTYFWEIPYELEIQYAQSNQLHPNRISNKAIFEFQSTDYEPYFGDRSTYRHFRYSVVDLDGRTITDLNSSENPTWFEPYNRRHMTPFSRYIGSNFYQIGYSVSSGFAPHYNYGNLIKINDQSGQIDEFLDGILVGLSNPYEAGEISSWDKEYMPLFNMITMQFGTNGQEPIISPDETYIAGETGSFFLYTGVSSDSSWQGYFIYDLVSSGLKRLIPDNNADIQRSNGNTEPTGLYSYDSSLLAFKTFNIDTGYEIQVFDTNTADVRYVVPSEIATGRDLLGFKLNNSELILHDSSDDNIVIYHLETGNQSVKSIRDIELSNGLYSSKFVSVTDDVALTANGKYLMFIHRGTWLNSELTTSGIIRYDIENDQVEHKAVPTDVNGSIRGYTYNGEHALYELSDGSYGAVYFELLPDYVEHNNIVISNNDPVDDSDDQGSDGDANGFGGENSSSSGGGSLSWVGILAFLFLVLRMRTNKKVLGVINLCRSQKSEKY